MSNFDTNTHRPITRVIGVFDNLDMAAQCLAEARDIGIPNDRINVVFADAPGAEEFLAGMESQTGPAALTGGAIGGAAMAVAATLLALPGLNVLAVGPMVAALGGAGVGAASGSALGALIGMGIPRNEAVLRLEDVQKGAVLIGIETDGSDAAAVADLLRAGRSVQVVHTTVPDAE